MALNGTPSEGYLSKSRYEASQEDERERKIEKSFSGVEPNIDNIFPSITKPCEEVLEEKFMFVAEPDIEINSSSTKKTNAGLIEKEEEEETNKEEDYFKTPFANIAKKEYLKGDFNTFNYSFKLYNVNSSSQKSKKQHFVMLLPSLGKEQNKENKNIFEKDCIFQTFYKNKGPWLRRLKPEKGAQETIISGRINCCLF